MRLKGLYRSIFLAHIIDSSSKNSTRDDIEIHSTKQIMTSNKHLFGSRPHYRPVSSCVRCHTTLNAKLQHIIDTQLPSLTQLNHLIILTSCRRAAATTCPAQACNGSMQRQPWARLAEPGPISQYTPSSRPAAHAAHGLDVCDRHETDRHQTDRCQTASLGLIIIIIIIIIKSHHLDKLMMNDNINIYQRPVSILCVMAKTWL